MGTSGGAVSHKSWSKLALYGYCHPSHSSQKQAGAELGQAQLKLGLGFTSTNLQGIARQLVVLY